MDVKFRPDVHLADQLVRDRRIREAEGRCARFPDCGGRSGPLEWAHVISRRYKATRWDDANAVVLCRDCHRWFTEHPEAWRQWCRSRGIPYDHLRYQALHGTPADPMDIIARERARR